VRVGAKGPAGGGGGRRGALLAAGLLAAATFGAFSGVAGHGFLPDYDDPYYVLENPWVTGGLTWAGIRWAFTSTYAAFWHPLTWLSHMLDVELFGLNPAGHHLSSVVLHLGAALAAFFSLRALTGALWRSALVAALFAVHPLHVESVAWVSERKDVLCGLFWFLGLGAYARYVRRPGALRYGAVLAAFAAALMAKSMAITFPFVLLLLDFWPLGRLRAGAGRARAWLEKLPLLLGVPAIAAVSYRAQVDFDAIARWHPFPLWQRAANALIAYAAYLAKTVAPVGLAAYYPHPGPAVSLPLAAACAAGLALATLGCALAARRLPWLATGWLWYLGTLVPVIGLVAVGEFAMADRYTYLPLVGVFIAAVWGAAALSRRLGVGAPARAAAALAVVVACAAAARVQAGYWRDPVALWSRAVLVTGENQHARLNLGLALLKAGEPGPAATQLREAIRINPNLFVAMYLLADALDQTGAREEAAAQRARARELDLAFRAAAAVPARGAQLGPRDYNNAGVGEARIGAFREAEAAFRKALALAPGYAGAHYNLANLYRDRGRPDDAYEEYLQAVRADPGFAAAYVSMGQLLQARGDLRGARAAYERALQARPNLAAARSLLEALPAAAP
jgi:tetratricopeptide (TPR) repeat protein